MKRVSLNFFGKKMIPIVLVIILIGIILPRFLLLDYLPNGLNWDEAAYGYNAFSLFKTGHDEWGNHWPILLKSFGEYKPALLSYFQIPFIKLFGLNALATRLPVVLISLIGLGSWFAIVKHFSHSQITAGFSVLIMATSPWHFHYSRAAMDPIVGFSFLLFGYSFYIQSKLRHRFWGLCWLLISAYCYNSTRAFVPMLTILHWKLISSKSDMALTFCYLKSYWFELLSIFLSLLLLVVLQFSHAGTRARAVFIFSKPEINYQVNECLYRSTVLGHPLPSLYSNKIITLTTKVIHHYLTHFDPVFLFFDRQLSPRHGFSGHGNLLLVTLPFLILGVMKSNSKDDRYFIFWLVLAPVVASVTDDVPHSGRVIIMLAGYSYLIAKGVRHLANHWIYKQKIILSLSLIAIIVNFFLYLIDYHRFYPEESYTSWQGDVRDLLTQIDHIESYQKVFINIPTQNIYIFDAFYHQIAPEIVQQAHQSGDTSRHLLNRQYGQYQLCNLLTYPEHKVLIVGDQPLILAVAQNEVEGQLYQNTLHFYNRFHPSENLYFFHDSSKLSDWQKSALTQECEALEHNAP